MRRAPLVSGALMVFLILSGLVELTRRAVRWNDLRAGNAEMRGMAGQLPQVRERRAELERLRASAAENENARRDGAELASLRAEAAALRAVVTNLPALHEEFRRLETERAVAAARAGVMDEPDPLARRREMSERGECLNNLKKISLAAWVWADAHNEVFAPDFGTMSVYLGTPKLLVCPADKPRKAASTWLEFDGSQVSYAWLSPDKPAADSALVLTRCPLHNNVGLSDDTAVSLSPLVRLELKDGSYRVVTGEGAQP
jgi:hypothetical protein